MRTLRRKARANATSSMLSPNVPACQSVTCGRFARTILSHAPQMLLPWLLDKPGKGVAMQPLIVDNDAAYLVI